MLYRLSHKGSLILYNRFSLIIYFIHSINNVYMSMPIFHLPFPVGIYTFVLYICVSISVLPIKSSISFFWIPHICINIQNYVSTSILFHSILQSLGQPHLCKWPNFVPLYGWVIFHCFYIPHLFFWKFFFWFFNFSILYWFCHISAWIRHRYTRVPHPELSSLLPPHTIPLGRPSAPAPSIQYHA